MGPGKRTAHTLAIAARPARRCLQRARPADARLIFQRPAAGACVNTSTMTAKVSQRARRPWYRPSLTMQIMIGLVVGGLIGWLRPDWGNAVYFLRDIFINLIKSIIAPLVFSTIVVGIAGAGALRNVGRMGVKALVYFEIVTTAALFIGLAVVNLTKPGAGVTLDATNMSAIQYIEHTHQKSLVETIVHALPTS